MAAAQTAQPVFAGAGGVWPFTPPPAQLDTLPDFEPIQEADLVEPDTGDSDQPGAEEIDAGNLVQFPAPEKPRRGRPPRDPGEDPRVSVEQVSAHTYAVRIRWFRPDGVKDGVVVNRLRDDIAKEIKRSKKRYEQFKNQTLSSWKSGPVRTGYQVGANTVGDV